MKIFSGSLSNEGKRGRNGAWGKISPWHSENNGSLKIGNGTNGTGHTCAHPVGAVHSELFHNASMGDLSPKNLREGSLVRMATDRRFQYVLTLGTRTSWLDREPSWTG